ncbi:hypothetical protein EIN_155300 [Entamoeba invadens IP1]|uniref:GTP-binding protein Rhes n=2 Tax=Entamoeba invadens TaxID=33085 RepID=A0A0A1UCN8_ENTIV|nr:hypothetical protein EIN_155300 [Entamoeba invadens IP1]ELP91423.1 hypothetical protein EIN_155300 [Entamoeba invadens IP1]BAN41430.1 hypothetical protein, conserved [Entamoeba invadens]|eukprot:XP_004258194.1 hypothetical protein EIN_155300 [Entamoeba invadens IP1]
MVNVKITFFGSSTVGKTSLIRRYLKKSLEEEYFPTIQDIFITKIESEGFAVDANIVDTSGDSTLSKMRDEQIIDSDYIVFVYSINDKETFESAHKDIGLCLTEVSASYKKHLPSVIIVGNKCDLKKEREVSCIAGEELAVKIRRVCPCAFLETSAKENTQVDVLFTTLATGIPEIELTPLSKSYSRPYLSPRSKFSRTKKILHIEKVKEEEKEHEVQSLTSSPTTSSITTLRLTVSVKEEHKHNTQKLDGRKKFLAEFIGFLTPRKTL